MSGSGSPLSPNGEAAAVIDLTESLPPSRSASPSVESFNREEDIDPLLLEEEMEELDHVSDLVHHLGSVKCTVVGIRYYDGVAHPGEFVQLVREPDNVYDSNAIRVDNVRLEKVGHIKATFAKILAPMMDALNVSLPTSTTRMEGTILAEANGYTLTLEIDFFSVLTMCGLSDFVRVDDLFRSNNQEWNPNPVFSAAIGQKNDERIEVVQQTMKWETAQENLDAMFEQLVHDQLLNLPSIAIPPSLTTPLLDHQVQGIRWMHHKEMMAVQKNLDDGLAASIPFYKPVQERGRNMWLCEITNSTQAAPPAPIKGSILADDMGLGKSIQAIGLILANPPRLAEVRATLIVCPLSVISNWVEQIEQHTLPNTLKVGIYHGSDRLKTLSKLSEIDVLLSPFGTIAADYCNVFQKSGVRAVGKNADKPSNPKKLKHGEGTTLPSIFECMFHRVILDEAHTIRNIKSKAYAGCMSLQSTYRLCLTGTPLQNKPDDIHSLLSFLAVDPLADRSIFRRSIGQPIMMGDLVGLSRLRTVMAHVALRRNKTTLNLVSKTVELRSIIFPEDCEHKRIHDTVFEAARAAFQVSLERDDEQASGSFMKIIAILMRIRQSCVSGNLVPQSCIAAAARVVDYLKNRKLSPEDAERLLEKLKGTFCDATECAVCFDSMDEAEAVIIRMCSHVFCEPCLVKVSQLGNGTCPLCRCQFAPKDVIKSSLVYETAKVDDSKPHAQTGKARNDLGPSPKLKALSLAIHEMQSHEKGVIFSQFTKMLDLLEVFLADEGHTFVRIDGSKSSAQRLTAMKEFSVEHGGPRFILCSLHAAGTGITLTRGNHCFMMDTWWNSSVEQQAMDRVHRIGQKLPVRIIRFVMKDTIEERMISLQEAKAAIGKGIMENLKPDEIRKARLKDLKSLFCLSES